MNGTVKWFSEQKGHGYLIGEDEQEYHIPIKAVKGVVLPSNGDKVTFEPSRNDRGLTVKNLVIVAKSTAAPANNPISNNNQNRNNDERVVCTGCNKKMIPRLVFNRGIVSKSVCPYCATTYKDFGYCFIATAVYGDYEQTPVRVLRQFRDKQLLTTSFGRLFVKVYYFCSPSIADFIREHRIFIKPIKAVLDKFVAKITGK